MLDCLIRLHLDLNPGVDQKVLKIIVILILGLNTEPIARFIPYF